MTKLPHEPTYYYADHLLLPFLTKLCSNHLVILICKIDFRKGFMVVQHNLAPGKKEEKPVQYEFSKDHNYQVIITAPVV